MIRQLSTTNIILFGSMILVNIANLTLFGSELPEYWRHWHQQLGVVIYPLLLLAGGLTSLVLLSFLSDQISQSQYKKLLYYAGVIRFSAIPIGFCGTLLGLQDGISHFAIAAGIEELLTAISMVLSGLTLSLTSTLWGVVISLLAGLLVKHLNKRQSELMQSETDEILPVAQPTEQFFNSEIHQRFLAIFNDVKGINGTLLKYKVIKQAHYFLCECELFTLNLLPDLRELLAKKMQAKQCMIRRVEGHNNYVNLVFIY